MKRRANWLLCFAAGLAVQAGVYLYLDGVLFSPDSGFKVTGVVEEQQPDSDTFGEVSGEGTRYVSFDRRYMAVVTPTSVVIHDAKDKKNTQTVDLKGREVSFFEWLPDRNLILMALYDPEARGTDDLIIAQYNPLTPDHELDTPIENVPAGAKVTSVAYSTATNAVYMKVRLREDAYRIYRTDANYDTRRIYVQAENIGRIAVFYDEDIFFYDDADEGVMYAFNGDDSSWRMISPPGFFRLIGVSDDKTIYAARCNRQKEAIELYEGKLGVGFETVAKLTAPVPFRDVTIVYVREHRGEGLETAGEKQR